MTGGRRGSTRAHHPADCAQRQDPAPPARIAAACQDVNGINEGGTIEYTPG